jgi:hypothetical protein
MAVSDSIRFWKAHSELILALEIDSFAFLHIWISGCAGILRLRRMGGRRS